MATTQTVEDSAEPQESTEPQNAVVIKTPSHRIEEKMQSLYGSKRTQQLFLLSSIASGDWIVCINFYVKGQEGWGIALVFFLMFHNVVSLLYHLSEHNEKAEANKAKSLERLKRTHEQNSVRSKIKRFEKKTKVSRQKRAVTAPTNPPLPRKNPNLEVKVSENLENQIKTEVEYDGSNKFKPWQIPFFLVGLGAYAASYECLLNGVQNQVYMENRYFEVLLESMPIGLVTIFGSLYNDDYDWIVLVSIATSAISVGSGTAIYFSRSHTHGNPLEFRPIITSKYLFLILGLFSSLDYIIRMYAPLLLIDALVKSDAWGMAILVPTFLLVMEIQFIHLIHGTKEFAYGFGWLALFSSSVPYFAAVATRFQNPSALWTEFIFRNFFNILCVVAALSMSWTRDDLKEYVFTLLALFVLCNGGFIWCVIETKKIHIQMFGDQIEQWSGRALGTRAQDLRRATTPSTPIV